MSLIKLQPSAISLSALNTYRSPAYPKAGEILDYDLSDTSQWPFSKALCSAVVAAMLLTPSAASAGTATVTADTKAKIVANPFTEKKSVLEMGGKGGPMTLPREVALLAIAKGFEKSGITLQSDVRYKAKGVQARLDGYNAKRKIGFEWVKPYSYDLDRTEIKRLYEDSALGQRHIAVIHASDARFLQSNPKAKENLTAAVQSYVSYLRSVGAL